MIDAFIEQGRCEFISELAEPLPTHIFLEMMDWPVTDAPQFHAWKEVIIHGVPGDEEASLAARMEAGLALYTYMAEVLDDRMESPREDDVMTLLIDSSFGGERPLTQFEILDITFLLLIAGLDTTTGALGNAKLPVATKTKILEVLRAIVENKGNQTRDSALWALAEHDPGGKAFAEKFAADPAKTPYPENRPPVQSGPQSRRQMAGHRQRTGAPVERCHRQGSGFLFACPANRLTRYRDRDCPPLSHWHLGDPFFLLDDRDRSRHVLCSCRLQQCISSFSQNARIANRSFDGFGSEWVPNISLCRVA